MSREKAGERSERRFSALAARFATPITWAIVAFGGAMEAIAWRFYVNPDGVSYLNMSDAYARGDWASSVNTYWSPGYPWLIGTIRRLHAWPPYWESSLVHVLNFAIYLASYACFRFMLRAVTRYQEEKRKNGESVHVVDWTKGWEFVLAHVLFLWSALMLIGVAIVTPDMMIAAEVYLIVALMVNMRRGQTGFAHPILLGVLLGVSYLTKAVMFPVAILVVACTGGLARKSSWIQRAVIAISFLVVSAPQVITVSREVGRPSFGESGRLNYAWYVNGYDQFWTGNPPGSGQPVHPVRQILSNPTVYDFTSADQSSSNPFWDKPAYWLQGIQPHFDPAQQMHGISRELDVYVSGFAMLFFGALILVLMRVRKRRLDFIGVCIVGFGVLTLYAFVHTEWRLAAPWSVILFIGLTSSLAFRDDSSSRAAVRSVLAAIAIWHILLTANAMTQATLDAASTLSAGASAHESWTIASALEQLGLRKGQRVAQIGNSSESYWARLAGVQIAMEIPPNVTDQYWTLDSAGKARVHAAFMDHGASMIVTYNPPVGGGPGWARLGPSALYGFPLSR